MTLPFTALINAHELGYIFTNITKYIMGTALILFRNLILEEFLQDSSLFPQVDWFYILSFKSAH